MGQVTLIVLAHPERRSFCGAWAEASAAAAAVAGDQVVWSDLYAMGFDAAERAAHYGASPDPFDPLKAQEQAAAAQALPGDVAAEVDKIRRADRIVFHFPLWWFAPPAILKGWTERALVHGLLHAVGQRFDRGLLAGKLAVFCVTTGAQAVESGPDGKEGETRLLLWPLAQTLRYCGMAVAEPVVVHGVHGYHNGAARAALEVRLAAVLEGQAALLAGLGARARMPFNPDTDFDAAGRLRPDAPSHWPFIRHPV